MEDKKIDFYSFEEITSRMERTNVIVRIEEGLTNPTGIPEVMT